MTAVKIVPAGYAEPVARTLVDAALADLVERYGGSGTTLETGRAQPEAITLYTKLGCDRSPTSATTATTGAVSRSAGPWPPDSAGCAAG
jgi:hypothetical protein